MTIRKGQQWGSMAVPPSDLTTVSSNSELRAAVQAARVSNTMLPVIALLGGDLMRTIGGTADATRLRSGDLVPHLPIDVVRVRVDDSREGWFVAHLVARRSWWRGRIVAAMNAQFISSWDVAPRAHPNDGLVDVVNVSAEMGLQQRWMARSRIRLGTHVPHPLITIDPRASMTIDLTRSTALWLDGERWGSGRHLQLDVEPDAFVVCV